MKFTKVSMCAVVSAAVLMMPSVSQAQTCGTGTADPSCTGTANAAVSTTTVLTTVIAVLAVGGIVWGIISTVQNSRRNEVNAQRAAELFLRENSLQLAQDMAAGSGPVLTDMASGMEVSKGHLAVFNRVMREHRRYLMSLADKSKLTPVRAAAFFREMAALIQGNPELAPDFGRFIAHQDSLASQS